MVFYGFWFAQCLICAGLAVLQGTQPKRKIAIDLAGEATRNLKYSYISDVKISMSRFSLSQFYIIPRLYS